MSKKQYVFGIVDLSKVSHISTLDDMKFSYQVEGVIYKVDLEGYLPPGNPSVKLYEEDLISLLNLEIKWVTIGSMSKRQVPEYHQDGKVISEDELKEKVRLSFEGNPTVSVIRIMPNSTNHRTRLNVTTDSSIEREKNNKNKLLGLYTGFVQQYKLCKGFE